MEQGPAHEPLPRAHWRLPRFGWAATTVFVVAGLAGLLGPGPLSSTTVRSPGGLLTLWYQRIGHHHANDSLTLTLARGAPHGRWVTVTVSGPWLASANLQTITPQPSEQILTPDGIVFILPTRGSGPSTVRLGFRAQGYGTVRGAAAVGNARVTFTQLILP